MKEYIKTGLIVLGVAAPLSLLAYLHHSTNKGIRERTLKEGYDKAYHELVPKIHGEGYNAGRHDALKECIETERSDRARCVHLCFMRSPYIKMSHIWEKVCYCVGGASYPLKGKK